MAYLMLLHHSYRYWLIRGALQRLPPPTARNLWYVGLGARLFDRLLAATVVTPSCCSISQVLCHCLTTSLFGLKASFSLNSFAFEISDRLLAIHVTIVPLGNRLAYVSPRIPQKSWKRFATACLHYTFGNKSTQIL